MNKLVQVREADHGTTGYRYHFHHEKMTREAVNRNENDFQGRQGQHKARDRGERAHMSETISGRERGGRLSTLETVIKAPW